MARLVSEMSNDADGVRILRYAALLCEKLAPQVTLFFLAFLIFY